jgi:gliding-associated putative ABC transporter substrate-binding component GldG
LASKKISENRQAGIRVAVLVVGLVLLNMLAARFHAGLDLTRERRFTLTKPTRQMLRNMSDYAVVDVLFTGKGVPAGFQRLHETVRERLQSFRDISGGKVVFSFRDPMEGVAEKDKKQVYSNLIDRGVTGTNIRQNNEEKYSEQVIFPSALISYRGKEVAVPLLENHAGMKPLEALNFSESQLEYKLANAINGLMRPDKPRIAYIMGNGEILGWNTYDGITSLQQNYHVDTLDLNEGTHIPLVYSAAIICKPTVAFDDKQKFKLDQYVMNGGHLLMMLDGAQATMDSLRNEQFIATSVNLGLDDLLFKWGVRLNPDLVEDLVSNQIFVNVGSSDQAQQERRSWFYLPVFMPVSQHPIARNLEVMSMYSSTLDTIANPEVKKTILLESSQYSRTVMTPARVSLSMLRYNPRSELYNKGHRATAVLLEGRFQSVFQNRLAPDFLNVLRDSLKMPYKSVADSAGSIVVVSDGDVFLNGFNRKSGPYEMGFWDVDGSRFDNKAFVMNALEYMIYPSGLLEARNKEFRLRLLDPGRSRDERSRWQAINIIVPLAMLLVFASAYLFFRKRRYGANAPKA